MGQGKDIGKHMHRNRYGHECRSPMSRWRRIGLTAVVRKAILESEHFLYKENSQAIVSSLAASIAWVGSVLDLSE